VAPSTRSPIYGDESNNSRTTGTNIRGRSLGPPRQIPSSKNWLDLAKPSLGHHTRTPLHKSHDVSGGICKHGDARSPGDIGRGQYGYARRVAGGNSEEERFELSDHAHRWIETLWGPLQREGHQLLERYGTKDLSVFARLLAEARVHPPLFTERALTD